MHVLGYLHARAGVADDRADHAIAVCGLYTRETEHRAVFVFVVKTVARVLAELSRHVVRLCVCVCVTRNPVCLRTRDWRVTSLAAFWDLGKRRRNALGVNFARKPCARPHCPSEHAPLCVVC